MASLRLIAMIAACGIVFAVATYVLARRFENKRIKFIPAFLSGGIVVLLLVKARFFSVGMEDLAYIILAMIAFGVFCISLLTALVMKFWKR